MRVYISFSLTFQTWRLWNLLVSTLFFLDHTTRLQLSIDAKRSLLEMDAQRFMANSGTKT